MPQQDQNDGPRGRKQPARSLATRPSESSVEGRARRADRVREQALHDPPTLALLAQAHRLREGQAGEWITFEDLDKRYPAED